jgi:E3 ubiquitin-protein ligase NRDP1
MGFAWDNFEPEPDEDLQCPVCHDVLQDAVSTTCGHSFCQLCITGWLEGHTECPIDRTELGDDADLSPAIALRNLISKLKVKCRYRVNGCEVVRIVSKIQDHEVNECPFDPVASVAFLCQDDCGFSLTSRSVAGHVCKDALKAKVTQLEDQVDMSKAELDSLRYEINRMEIEATVSVSEIENLRSEVNRLKTGSEQNSTEEVKRLQLEVARLRAWTPGDNVELGAEVIRLRKELRDCQQLNEEILRASDLFNAK